ncbi:MAG: hypothetical protein CMO97_02170 [Woeseia sp.]|nr:hypothetical protein [Woeseia sp.]
MINKGDIVNFYSTVASFQESYRMRNPGIVVASQEPNGKYYDKGHAYILWTDGSITREHLTYLKGVESV